MTEQIRTLGHVVSLWRYPVKSMIGEELNASEVTERGLLGDRAYALLDPTTGKIVSAKNPGKWARMFDFRARFVEAPKPEGQMPQVIVTCPDGTMVESGSPDVDRVLSKALGRAVRFVTTAPDSPRYEEYWPDIEGLSHREKVTEEAMPPRTFFDLATLHLLTTATLAKLQELNPEGRFETRRFRPNVVVRAAEQARGFVEDTWIGKSVQIGDHTRVTFTGPCIRCVMTTLPQGDLPQDGSILRTAAKHHGVSVGVYASIARGGLVRRGDPVSISGM